jgi:hypothetical protein
LQQIFAGKTGFTLETYAFPSFCQKCHLQDTKNSPKRSTLFWNINKKTIGGLGGNNTLSWPHLKMI